MSRAALFMNLHMHGGQVQVQYAPEDRFCHASIL